MQEIRHNLRKLVESPAWTYITMMAEEQIKLRQKIVNTPAKSSDFLLEKECALNENAGIMLVLRLPEMQLQGIEEEMEELKLDIEEMRNETSEK